MTGVSEIFPTAEHRECMWHLVQNFKKRYWGKVYDEHLWVAAYSWNTYMFDKHIHAMAAENPAAILYLQENLLCDPSNAMSKKRKNKSSSTTGAKKQKRTSAAEASDPSVR